MNLAIRVRLYFSVSDKPMLFVFWPWWRHQMETFSALLVICGHRWTPLTKEWHGALMFSLICAWINGWGWWFETPSRPLWRHCKVRVRQAYAICILTYCFPLPVPSRSTTNCSSNDSLWAFPRTDWWTGCWVGNSSLRVSWILRTTLLTSRNVILIWWIRRTMACRYGKI